VTNALAKPWLCYLLAAFATYRVTHLIAREDGPGALLARLRRRLGSGFWGSLMDCFKCVSVWVAAPFACFASSADAVEWTVTWLALSGVACFLDALTERAASAHAPAPPVVIERLANPEEVPSELLWTESKSAEQANDARPERRA
jgi:hypothetical protein